MESRSCTRLASRFVSFRSRHYQPINKSAYSVTNVKGCVESNLAFPTIGAVQTWPLQTLQVDRWQVLYPTLDVMAECRKALAWTDANPSKRKTPKGMPRFLVHWLNRATSAPAPATVRQGYQPRSEPAYDSDWFHECAALHENSCNGQTVHAVRLRIDAGRNV